MRPSVLLLLLSPLIVAAAPPAAQAPKPDHPAPAPAHAQAAPPAKPAAAKPPAPADHPSAPSLLAAIPPGPPADTLRRIFLKPYAAASGTDVAAPAWDGSPDALHTLLAAHGADLVLLDAATLADQCRAQTLVRLDWTMLDRARTLPGAATDCGAGAYLAATGLAWDRAKLPGVTPSWGDFWDVARHPGRRGLQSRARGNLEIALLADGVQPGDIYRTLRTPDGIDRAFRKLDQLKPYVVWWDQPAQAVELLGSGKALLTSAPIDTIAAAGHPTLGYAAAGNLTGWWSWAIPQAAPHAAAAALALVIAADPARQADFARATGLGPAISMALDLLPATLRAASPSLGANISQSLAVDEGFWAENRDKLEARFSAWLKQS